MNEKQKHDNLIYWTKYYSGCKTIFDYYGIDKQKKQLIQELAELIQAITKNDKENFIEELADVQVLIHQFVIADAELEEKFHNIKLAKINRQLQRIKAEKK